MKPLVLSGSQGPCTGLDRGSCPCCLGSSCGSGCPQWVLRQSCLGNGEAAWGHGNRWAGKEIKREKERARNRKMKGLVAPWQQLYGFPWEPQAGTGMFLGHAEVCNAPLAQPPRAGTLPSPVCTFPNQALSPHWGLRLDSPIRPLPEKFWLCVNFATCSRGEKRWEGTWASCWACPATPLCTATKCCNKPAEDKAGTGGNGTNAFYE